MRKLKSVILSVLLAAVLCLLSGCGQVDESFLDSTADFSVNISVPFPTTTPLAGSHDTPEQIVIDSDGNVTVNDPSLLISSYTIPKNEQEQSAYSTLSLGDTGFAVQTLQQRLQTLGYFTGGISGIFDAETEKAVERFEKTYGIMRTGIATPAFQSRLFSSGAPYYDSDAYDTAVVSQYTTLQLGAVGSSVYALQHRLKELGYPISQITGIYDAETEDVVCLFYAANGVEPQPVAYIAMQMALYSEDAVPYSIDGRVQRTEIDSNTLVPGNVGTLIMQLQNRLIELGYMNANASGIFDPETEAAVRLFEESCGFEITGTLPDYLQAILLSDSAPAYGQTFASEVTSYSDLAEGDSGEGVRAMQDRLIALGYAAGQGNGVYGSETTAAVRMFQRYNHLDETGVATAYVQSCMFSSMAISYEDVLNGITVRSTPAPLATAAPVQEEIPVAATLTLNSKGETVEKLQRRLNELGYVCEITGTYDSATFRIIRQIQAAIGVTQSGEAGASLQMYIFSDAAPDAGVIINTATQHYTSLRIGDTGEDVIRLQQRLWQLGYLLTESVKDSIGTYHNATKLAVASAQLAMGYQETDGIAGPEFQCFLFSEFGDGIKK